MKHEPWVRCFQMHMFWWCTGPQITAQQWRLQNEESKNGSREGKKDQLSTLYLHLYRALVIKELAIQENIHSIWIYLIFVTAPALKYAFTFVAVVVITQCRCCLFHWLCAIFLYLDIFQWEKPQPSFIKGKGFRNVLNTVLLLVFILLK